MDYKDLKRPLKKVEVHLQSQSFPLLIDHVMNCYEKGQFYCVVVLDTNGKRKVQKYPIANIFRILEEYDV